jgi:hypothetical protein
MEVLHTPKEKAQELFSDYRAFLSIPGAPLGDKKDSIAKQLAKHTVSEMHIALDSVDWMQVQNLDREHAFWNEVEMEIDKIPA